MVGETSSPIRTFIERVPKAELHLHLVGSASVGTVARLALRKGDGAVPSEEAGLRRYYRFSDFAHFIKVYGDVTGLLRTAEDFELLVNELGRDLARQQIRYAEVTVTPYMHTIRGVSEPEIFQGIEQGRQKVEREFGVRLRWCFDIPGEYGLEAGMETVRMVLKHRPRGMISLGLGGPERGVSRAKFRQPFMVARDAGLHSVPHAGETTGPDTIWSALTDLSAERIGHGTSCLDDAGLVAQLRERQIPLEVCPTSNVRTGQVPSVAAHPIRRMLDAGLLVTVNSDDPGMFETDLIEEYWTLAEAFSLNISELAQLVRNGVAASFLDDQTKQELLTEIDHVVTRSSGPRNE